MQYGQCHQLKHTQQQSTFRTAAPRPLWPSPYVPESTFNLLKPLNEFFDFEDNDEKALLRLFKCEKLTISERKILLKLMQKIFFIEKMTIENFMYLKKQITSKEYL